MGLSLFLCNMGGVISTSEGFVKIKGDVCSLAQYLELGV